MKQESHRTNQLIELDELVREISAGLPPPPNPAHTPILQRTPAEEMQVYLIAQLAAFFSAHSGELDPLSHVLENQSTRSKESSGEISRKESSSND